MNLPYDPNITRLLVDRRGIIRDAGPNPERLLVYAHRELVNRPLSDVLVPLGGTAAIYLNLTALPETMSCPAIMFVQVSHPSVFGEYGILQYSYSSWFTLAKKRYTIVSLTLHTYGGPAIQKFLTLYRSENVPLIMLDARFNIVSFNYHFHEILNFVDDKTFYYKSIVQLLAKQYRTPNPFLFQRKTHYIHEVVLRRGGEWTKIYDLFDYGVPKSLEAAGIYSKRPVTIVPLRHGIVIKETPLHLDAASQTLTLAKGINAADQDIEIRLEINTRNQCSVTLVLGPRAFGTLSNRFDGGYQLDLDMSNNVTATFMRRSAVLFSKTVKTARAVVTVRRTGAYFEVYINNKSLGSYADPQPIFGNYASHLSLFMWKGDLELFQMAVKSRKSLFNLEEMAEQDAQVVEFERAPDKLFKFIAEPVSYRGKEHALAVRFYPIPGSAHIKKKDYYASLFESARNYIQKNYFRHIDFKSLARQCCVSFKHFITKFRSLYGASPKAYQTAIRVKETQILLKIGKMQVQEAGALVGFDDPIYFQRIFKKHVGCTPGEYAKKTKALQRIRHFARRKH